MSWSKIYALSLRHIYLIKGSFPRILDLIYWPTIQIFLWGFISKFFTLNSTYYENTVGIILSAAILYDFLFRSSISYNMMFLEEIWSRNFTNLFIAPIKISEIITALTFTAIFRTLIGLIPQVFIWVSLGSGLEKIIDQNEEAPSIVKLISSSDIYIPIIAFIILVIITITIRKIFYKK